MAVRRGVAALTLVLVAACGGDDRLSREEYLARADAICTKYEEKLAELGRPRSFEEAVAIGDEAIPLLRDGVDELKELEPPKELEARVDAWNALNERNVEFAEDLRDAAKRRDRARVRAVARATEANEQRADRAARDIGLRACGAGG